MMPVEARGKRFCRFPRSGGRVLFASTAPAASTGSSRLPAFPGATLLGKLLKDVVVGSAVVPRMIRRDVWAIPHRARYRRGGRRGAQRQGHGERRCRVLGPP